MRKKHTQILIRHFHLPSSVRRFSYLLPHIIETSYIRITIVAMNWFNLSEVFVFEKICGCNNILKQENMNKIWDYELLLDGQLEVMKRL